MVVPAGDLPWGLGFINWIGMKCWPHRRMNKLSWHRGGVLALTYLAYTCYHMSRKPISVVKNVLYHNCTGLIPPPDIPIDDDNRDNWCDWAPFGKIFFIILKNKILSIIIFINLINRYS